MPKKENTKLISQEDSETKKMRKEVLKVLKEPAESFPEKTENQSNLKKPVPSLPLKPKKSLSPTKKIFLFLVIIIFGVALALAVFGVGLYRFHWSNNFTKRVVKIIPYPAILVDFQMVRLSDFQDDFDTLTFYFQSQSKNNSSFQVPEESQIKEIIVEKLINDELLKRLARKDNITVSEEEVEAEFNKIKEIGQNLGEENIDLEKVLKDYYNWDAIQYKQKVLKPFLLAYKVQDKISADFQLNAAAYERTQKILEEVKEGKKDFAELAQTYSEDLSTASQGGDFGFLGQGERGDKFDEAAFSLSESEVSDIVPTIEGYQIIKVEEKLKGENDEEKIRGRHILIKTKTVDELIAEEKDKVRIYNLVS